MNDLAEHLVSVYPNGAYQPVDLPGPSGERVRIINGRACDQRWAMIRKVLDERMPRAVVDVGSSLGFNTIRAAVDHLLPVMSYEQDGKQRKLQKRIVEAWGVTTRVTIRERFTEGSWKYLPDESLILLLGVLHYFPENEWQLIERLATKGRLIVELTNPEEWADYQDSIKRLADFEQGCSVRGLRCKRLGDVLAPAYDTLRRDIWAVWRDE